MIPEVPCLYEVSIHHAREAPVRHAFRHNSHMWVFDIDDPPRLPLWLRRLARYRAADHIDVRALLRSEGISATRVLALANLRVLGYVFNPITIYWCYDADATLVAHVAEVHNTYGGRHAYLMPARAESAGSNTGATVRKAMYVSPFNPVDGDYRIRIGEPTERLHVSVTLDRGDGKLFRAALTGRRLEPAARTVLRSFARHPVAPLRGRTLIQFEGLRLWRKGLEIQPR